MNNDLNVWVLTHKKNKYDLNDANHINLQVGAAISNEHIYDYRDNIGENISEKNPIYLETTGHYCVWKNFNTSKYVGFEHYRRHFDLSKKDIETILSVNEIILPRKMFFNITLEEQYKNCHSQYDLNLCKEILFEKFPEYKESYKKYIEQGRFIYIANSFITTKENFNGICEFIFSIFDEFEKRVGYKNIEEWRKHAETHSVKVCPEDHKKNGLTWVY